MFGFGFWSLRTILHHLFISTSLPLPLQLGPMLTLQLLEVSCGLLLQNIKAVGPTGIISIRVKNKLVFFLFFSWDIQI